MGFRFQGDRAENVLRIPIRTGLGITAALTATFALVSPANAAEPASRYNGPMADDGEGVAYECVRPRNPDAPIEMWALDGSDTTFRFNGVTWGGKKPCDDGELRISKFPPVRINGSIMYLQRGYKGSTAQDPEAVRHGHVRADDLSQAGLAKLRRPVSPGARNGRPCARTKNVVYFNNPGPIPENFQYKPKEDSSDWDNYGDPAQVDGEYHPPGLHYNYLLWSWPTDAQNTAKKNPGGGQIRAVIKKNDRIRLCDVAPIISPAYKEGKTEVIGYVRGMYGRARSNSGQSVEGWFVHSWRPAGSSRWTELVSRTPVP